MDELAQKEKHVKRLERKVRDRSVPLSGISPDQLAQGKDVYQVTTVFQDSQKRLLSIDVPMEWDEILAVIGPTMYGYIVRRAPANYKQLVGQYSFEGALIEYIRTKIIDKCGARQITIMPHQIDTIFIQLKQLGLIAMTEKTAEEDGEEFRGYSLTVAGEERLTRTKIQLQSDAH